MIGEIVQRLIMGASTVISSRWRRCNDDAESPEFRGTILPLCPLSDSTERRRGSLMSALHRRYYSDDLGVDRGYWTPPPYLEIETRIGSFLREQYEPPKGLPHQLLTLLMQLNEQENDD